MQNKDNVQLNVVTVTVIETIRLYFYQVEISNINFPMNGNPEPARQSSKPIDTNGRISRKAAISIYRQFIELK